MKRLILFLLFLTVFFLNETFNVSEKLQPLFYRITFPFLKLRANGSGSDFEVSKQDLSR
ncbi:hypothetical protein [Thermotoga maritima]|uniref:hypothetical protein n=1 Tax=Thermotoga maritima TaxID=2336 RepID=UPI0002F055BA|nr:hypothetical protein [Thermotoga maritima]